MAKRRKYLTIIWKSWMCSPIVNIWDTKSAAWENLVYYYEAAINCPDDGRHVENSTLRKDMDDGCGYVGYTDGYHIDFAVVSIVD